MTANVVNTTQGPLPCTPEGHQLPAGESTDVDDEQEPVKGLIAGGYLYVLDAEPEPAPTPAPPKSTRTTTQEG